MIAKSNSISQKAINTCVTGMILDLSRLFNRKAQILNVDDKRYWEERLKWADTQYTQSTDDLFIEFAGQVEVLRDQMTAPTTIFYNYVEQSTSKIQQLQIRAKRHTLNIPIRCKIETTSFVSALDVFEDILSRSSKPRTFSYAIWGTEHKAAYRINFNPETEKSVYDYTNTDNGVAVTFDLVLEMHFYAPVYRSHAESEFKIEKLKVTKTVDIGGTVVEVEETIEVLVYNNADISDRNEGLITKTLHSIIVKNATTNKYVY